MSKLLEDPKVANLVEKKVAKAVKAERARVATIIKGSPMKTIDDAVGRIDAILHYAKHQGLDPELILTKVYADHLMSDERCDSCHMYGITFAEKLNNLMEGYYETK